MQLKRKKKNPLTVFLRRHPFRSSALTPADGEKKPLLSSVRDDADFFFLLQTRTSHPQDVFIFNKHPRFLKNIIIIIININNFACFFLIFFPLLI